MKNLILITDPNEDTDDLVSLMFCSALVKTEKINLLGVVATVGNKETRTKRAKYANGILKLLNTNAPVCAGADYKFDYSSRKLQDDIFLDSKYLSKILDKGQDIQKSKNFISDILENTQDNSVTIVNIAGMTDLSNAMRDYSKLFNQKVKEVYLMSNFVQTKSQGIYQPDFAAHNNQIDPPNTQFVYEYLQKNNIDTYVINSKNTKKVPVSMKYYEDMKLNESIVANHAYEIQKEGLKQHYQNILVGKAEEKYTIEWFYNTFTILRDYEPQPFDYVWKHIDRLYLYDPLTVLVSIDEYRESYFEMEKFGCIKLCCPKNLDAIYRLFKELPKIAINY